jgi:hypothetical protein
VYIDLVEVLDLPDIYVEHLGLDHMLEPISPHFYNFEQITQVPDNMIPQGKVKNMTLSRKEVLSDGAQSLKLDLELEPYDSLTETGWGGIHIDLDDVRRVEAMAFSIFIPTQQNTIDANFGAFFVAVDDEGGYVYSGSRPIPVGEWSPQFWGTRYVYNGPTLCLDENKDGQCDEPAEQWWYAWYETDIKAFDVRIICNGESYQGPVYIDNLAVYQLRP